MQPSDGLGDEDAELLGEILALGLTDGDTDELGDTLADGDTEGLTDEDGDTLADGETDALAEDDGLPPATDSTTNRTASTLSVVSPRCTFTFVVVERLVVINRLSKFEPVPVAVFVASVKVFAVEPTAVIVWAVGLLTPDIAWL